MSAEAHIITPNLRGSCVTVQNRVHVLFRPAGTCNSRPITATSSALTSARGTGEAKGTLFTAWSKEGTMFRALVEEAAALTSLVFFLGTVAIWAHVLAVP